MFGLRCIFLRKESAKGMIRLKRMIVLMGICCMAGSLCACGDDTGVSLEQETGTLLAENDSRVSLEDMVSEREDVDVVSLEDLASERENIDVEFVEETVDEIEEAEILESGTVSITISFAGDVTLGNYPEQGYYLSLPYTYEEYQDDSYFFENVYEIFAEDDMTLVNLEGGFTEAEERREGQTYSIKGKPEYVKALTAGSVEAVSMGNNHRLDYLEQGSKDTVAVLEDEGVIYAYDENIGIYETNGIRIGFVSVNEVSQGWLVEKYLQEGIQALQEQEVNLILACCHWGIEREYYPEEYQQSLGKKCIDWGADLVIGHHPHVLQGIEEYQGKFIIYSLGNFCFGANKNPPDKDTMIVQQTFTFVDGMKQEDQEIRVIPCSISSVKERNDFKPTPAEGEEAQRILDRINEFSRDLGVQLDNEGRLIK